MSLSKILFFLSFFLCFSVNAAVNKPFPQQLNFPGCIKPAVQQSELNDVVTSLYDTYKSSFMKSASGRWYVEAEGEGPDGGSAATISEAHGYAMIIVTLMAGYDANAQTIFDGMNTLRKEHESSYETGLMSWIVYDPSDPNDYVSTAATDGDLDMAYALLLAYDQWGDASYLSDAQELINNIKESEMSTSTYRTMLGDWDYDDYSTRPSDWMPGHFRSFATATNDNFWNTAAQTVYTMLGQLQDGSTGLVSDFATGSPCEPDPYAGGTGEDNADNYSYNACRVPWRIALDYAHNGVSSAKTDLDKLYTWLRSETGNQAGNIMAGYNLDGDAIVGYNDIIFTAPFGAGAITNTSNQTLLNSIWSEMKNTGLQDAYATALNLLSALLISGNWWAPGSEGNGTTTYFVLINNGSGSGNYEKGDNVTIVASEAPAGFEFDYWSGDITGLINENDSVATFSMPAKNLTFTANYKAGDNVELGPDLVIEAGWKALEGDLGSSASVDTSKVGSDNLVSGTISLTGNDSDDDCWGSIIAYADGDFTSFYRLSITYKSDETIRVTLEDPDLSKFGVAYGYDLPSTGGSYSTVLIELAQFEQPEWAESENLDAPLDLKKINGISIEAVNKPATTNISITKLRADGLILAPNSIQLTMGSSLMNSVLVKGNQIQFSGLLGTNAKLKLFDLRGRVLFSQKVNLVKGKANVTLPTEIQSGKMGLLSVETNRKRSTYKMIFK